MLYQNGKEVRVGDRVKLANGEMGTVVFSIDSNEFSTEYPRKDWVYLAAGILIKTNAGALIHLKDPNLRDVELL